MATQFRYRYVPICISELLCVVLNLRFLRKKCILKSCTRHLMAWTDPCVNALSGAWQQFKPESHTNAINDIKNDSTIKVRVC